MTLPLLLTLPWVAVLLFGAFAVKRPRTLPRSGEERTDPPSVSIVVPARNEADTIKSCVASLAALRYPDFEIVVVDDRSDDDTGALARQVEPHNATRVEVVDGEPLPDGWLGKPWACWQGYRRARGDVVLFTDADTVHGPDLLARAVRALEEDGAAGVTVVGRQILRSFWEKLVMPQVFTLIAFRFPDLRRPVGPGECRDAIASGQYVMLHREAYEDVGGHRALKGEVVEDLRLAQLLCRAGHRLSVREAEDALATRMYRSLGHMVEGWSKNLAIASLQTLPRGVRSVALPVMFLIGAGLWLAPPLALGLSLAGVGGVGLTLWSGVAVGLSVLFWAGAAHQMRIGRAWGLLYPLGSAVTGWIFLRSWRRGTTVEWKGRTYQVDAALLDEE